MPNSGVNSYIYGQGVSSDAYNKQIQDKLNQGLTSVECPVSNPYPGTSQCVGCPDQSYIFDISKSVCMKCPAGSSFDITTHLCLATPFNMAPSAKNYIGVLPPAVAGGSTCPDSTPFYDGSQCVGCAYPRYFDFSDKTCKGCPEGLSFSLATHLCGYHQFNSNVEAGSNICCGSLPSDDTL